MTASHSSPFAEPPSPNAEAPSDPNGQIPMPFAYSFSQQPAIQTSGGSYKIADSTVFNVSKEVAVAEITVVPGGMRELHVCTLYQLVLPPDLTDKYWLQWHPTQDEWGFFL